MSAGPRGSRADDPDDNAIRSGWGRHTGVGWTTPPHLRVLIADQDQRHIAEIASVISGLLHAVVARLLDVSEIAKATRRGIRPYVKHGERPEMKHTVDIVLSRYAEFTKLHGALHTAAIIEQATGILVKRHGIGPTKRSRSCGSALGMLIRACSKRPRPSPSAIPCSSRARSTTT